MGKNTSLALLPKPGKTSNSRASNLKDHNEPSQQVISNILSYSRALKVEKRPKGNDFVEYIIN